MRIGYIVYDSDAYTEGFLRHEITLLKELGHVVYVFSKSPLNARIDCKQVYGGLRTDGLYAIDIFKFSLLFIKSFLKASKLFRMERKAGASIKTALKRVYLSIYILPHKLDCLVLTFPSLIIERGYVAKAVNAKMILCIRGFDLNFFKDNKQNLKLVDMFFVRSKELYEELLCYGVDTKIPNMIIPTAIDTEKIRFNPQIKLKNNPIRIVSVGRLCYNKGYEWTLNALNILAQSGTNFTFTIVGAGAEENKLRSISKLFLLEDKITFTGAISNEKVLQLLQLSDLFIHSSVSEGTCNAVLEAQASGVFCIVSDIPGNLVLNNKTGFTYPVQDAEQLYIKIKEYIRLSEQDRERILATARTNIEREYTLTTLKNNLKDFYQRTF